MEEDCGKTSQIVRLLLGPGSSAQGQETAESEPRTEAGPSQDSERGQQMPRSEACGKRIVRLRLGPGSSAQGQETAESEPCTEAVPSQDIERGQQMPRSEACGKNSLIGRLRLGPGSSAQGQETAELEPRTEAVPSQDIERGQQMPRSEACGKRIVRLKLGPGSSAQGQETAESEPRTEAGSSQDSERGQQMPRSEACGKNSLIGRLRLGPGSSAQGQETAELEPRTEAVPSQINRRARELFVGGIPPGVERKELEDYLNACISYIQGAAGQNLQELYLRDGYCYICMSTSDVAANALALDGIYFKGAKLRVKRISNFNASDFPWTQRFPTIEASQRAKLLKGWAEDQHRDLVARELTIMGLPPAVKEEDVTAFFNKWMAFISPGGEKYVEQVDHRQGRRMCTIWLRTPQMAADCLALDGILLAGFPIAVKRPNTYNPWANLYMQRYPTRASLQLAMQLKAAVHDNLQLEE